MQRNLRLAHLAGIALASLAIATAASERIHLAPKFTPGESLRYQIEMRTSSTGTTTTPIENPEGGSKFSQAISLLVRLDVLPPPSPAGALGEVQGSPAAPSPQVKDANFGIHFRATYEKSEASSESDAFNPSSPSLADQYARLEGLSVEFTLQPDGKLADFKGLAAAPPNPIDADRMLSPVLSPGPSLGPSSASTLSPASSFPRDGIAIGQKWTADRPLTGTPLADLVWHTESTYLRNEDCNSSTAANSVTPPQPPAAANNVVTNLCAVILTHFEILRHGGARSDATPEDYLHNGLRTSGTWTGSGESLDSISLSSGLLISSTQTSSQKMDYQIVSASSGSAIHHVGEVTAQSQINLVSSSLPQP
jgi:hypothetical protein